MVFVVISGVHARRRPRRKDGEKFVHALVQSMLEYYSHQGFLQTMVKFSMLRNSKPLELVMQPFKRFLAL